MVFLDLLLHLSHVVDIIFSPTYTSDMMTYMRSATEDHFTHLSNLHQQEKVAECVIPSADTVTAAQRAPKCQIYCGCQLIGTAQIRRRHVCGHDTVHTKNFSYCIVTRNLTVILSARDGSLLLFRKW